MAETYWFVGASYNSSTDDQTQRFLADGIWENGYDDHYQELVNSMQPGQRIAIKSTCTQKHKLPFDAKGKTVSVMKIKAIGTITENMHDGKRVKVNWEKVFNPPRRWYFFTYQPTVWRVEATDDWRHEGLINFTFNGQQQDIERFLNARSESELEDADVPPTLQAAETQTQANQGSGECRNVIYYGPPGTGKTYTVIEKELKKNYGYVNGKEENPRYRFVTFHQSYGYEEFVEGLRPVLNDKSGTGEVRYEIRAGVFKELCERAREEPEQRFAMVIDEINRGNISKIFGELITLIEPDKREGAKNAVTVTLPYSGDKFSVPANVDIVGTMNTADRSLALLDAALRRRFKFEELRPDASTLSGLKVGEIDVRQMLERINERIEVLYDREHCIGHAYFMALKEDPRLETLASIFRKRILPLLEEYFFEDWQKIRLVLGDNQKDEGFQFITKSGSHEQDLKTLFGNNDHSLNYVAKHRYRVQKEAFMKPEAYIGIYKSDKPTA